MRRLAACLGLGLALLYSRTADALPRLEVSTTLGGAEASEYLVRVANPEAAESTGVIELRHQGSELVAARAPYSVPARSTRYFRIPGEKAQRLAAVAVTEAGTVVRAHERYANDGPFVLFAIPPRDDQRLRELRVHSGPNAVLAHAAYDDASHAPVLTRRAAVYEGAALVIVPSSVWLALPAAERDALTTWVRAGGAIAFAVTDQHDLPRLSALIGDGVTGIDFVPGIQGATYTGSYIDWRGGRLHPASFGATAGLGLGYVHLLPVDPWAPEVNGDVGIQEKLVALADQHRVSSRFLSEQTWMEGPMPSLDPNQGYRSVMAIAGVLLAVQALVSAIAFRRLAIKRGMGAAYRFVALSSGVTFAAVVGLGVHAKGGFGARAREISCADAASGEPVAWVQRNRTYFASDSRTIEVLPRDASNVIDLRARDSRAVLHVDDAGIVLGDVGVRPWQTTAVTERGTTTLGEGVRIEYEHGNVVVRNRSGGTLRHVIVATPAGTCLDFGEIPNREDKTSSTPHSCTDLGPAWTVHQHPYLTPVERYLVSSPRLTLIGQLDEDGPASISGFRVEKRTTLLRVRGGAS